MTTNQRTTNQGTKMSTAYTGIIMLNRIVKSLLCRRLSADDIDENDCGKYCIVKRSDGRLFRGFIQSVRMVKLNQRHMLTVRIPGEGYKNVYLDDLVYTFVK